MEWVIVGGKSYVFIFKLVCSSLEIRRFRGLTFLWCVFEGLECDCLIHLLFSLELSVSVILMYVSRETGGEVVEEKPVLGVCLVEATRCNCGDSGAFS